MLVTNWLVSEKKKKKIAIEETFKAGNDKKDTSQNWKKKSKSNGLIDNWKSSFL